MKILLSLLLLGFIGCNQSGSSGDSPTTVVVRKPQTNEPTPNNPKKCLTDKVVEVLKDRKSILSRLAKDNNSMVIWDYQSLSQKVEIGSSKSYHQLSPSGEFILRRLNPRQYLLEHLAENSSYQESLFFYGEVISINFSLKSDFVVTVYRTRGNRDRISIFDIIKREKVFDRSLKNVKFSHMVDDENLFIVAGFGISNILYHYNITQDSMKMHKLKSGELRWGGISKNILLAKIDHDHYAYDLTTSEEKYSLKLQSIYDYDYDTDLAVISSADEFNHVSILNMITGESIFSAKRPDNLYPSTCRLTPNRNELLCESKSDSNKVVLWNLEKNLTKEICY